MSKRSHAYVVVNDHEPKVVCLTKKAAVEEISRIHPSGVEIYKVPISIKKKNGKK